MPRVKILARMCVSAGLSEPSLLVDAISRVKSGNFVNQVNSDSDLVCFILQLLE